MARVTGSSSSADVRDSAFEVQWPEVSGTELWGHIRTQLQTPGDIALILRQLQIIQWSRTGPPYVQLVRQRSRQNVRTTAFGCMGVITARTQTLQAPTLSDLVIVGPRQSRPNTSSSGR